MKREILCTIGPVSLKESVLKRLNELPITLLRINMSHTRLRGLPKAIKIGLDMGSRHIALSFAGCGEEVLKLKELVLDNEVFIISKND